MPYTKMTQEEIIVRENAICDEGRQAGLSEQQIIKERSKDRKLRWREHIAAMTIRPEIASWAADMEKKFCPKVDIHHNTKCDWVMALMIVRYGEAEYHWPMEFSDDDVARAIKMKFGKLGDVRLPEPDEE